MYNWVDWNSGYGYDEGIVTGEVGSIDKDEKKENDGNFKIDKKTGLFLPEGVKVRDIPFGFTGAK